MDVIINLLSTITLRLSFQSESSVSGTQLRILLKTHYEYTLVKWIHTTGSVVTHYVVSTSFSAYS